MDQIKKIKPVLVVVVPLLFCLLLLLDRERMDVGEIFVVAASAFFGCRILVSYLINEEIDLPPGGSIPAGDKFSFLRIFAVAIGAGFFLLALAVILEIIQVP